MALQWNSELGQYEMAPSEVDFGVDESVLPPTPAAKQMQAPPSQVPESGMSKVADLAMAGGAASANPAIAGAGVGLKALSMIQQGRQQERMNEYQNKVQKYNARQQALSQLAQIGQNQKV
jgi:hypothetical protein